MLHNIAKDVIHVIIRKNADYAIGLSADDPFINFKMCEQYGVATLEQGMLCRILDKISRMSSIINKGSTEIKDESLADTALDLVGYSLILASYLKLKEQNGKIARS